MSAKKRKTTHGLHREYAGNTRNNRSFRSTNHGSRMKYYSCEICGSTLPGSAHIPPLCPRCLIPMSRSSDGVSNVKRNRAPTRPAFDYSARIYHQTDGHPQYIGLPLDHPDPEDEEAVAEYLARKQAQRSRGRRNRDDSQSRRSRRSNSRNNYRTEHSQQNNSQGSAQNSRKQQQSSRQDPERQSRSRPRRRPRSQRSHEQNSDRNSASARNATPSGEMHKKESAKPAGRKQSPRPRRSPAIKEEDYAGTAITGDQSTITLLNTALNKSTPESAPEPAPTESSDNIAVQAGTDSQA